MSLYFVDNVITTGTTIRFIGHSAASGLIESVAQVIKGKASSTVIHETFLDPFLGWNNWERDLLGIHGDWSDTYISLVASAAKNSYNVDITKLFPAFCGLECEHEFALDFYEDTITNSANTLFEDRGLPLGKYVWYEPPPEPGL